MIDIVWEDEQRKKSAIRQRRPDTDVGLAPQATEPIAEQATHTNLEKYDTDLGASNFPNNDPKCGFRSERKLLVNSGRTLESEVQEALDQSCAHLKEKSIERLTTRWTWGIGCTITHKNFISRKKALENGEMRLEKEIHLRQS